MEVGFFGIIVVVDKVIFEKWCFEVCLGFFYINVFVVLL